MCDVPLGERWGTQMSDEPARFQMKLHNVFVGTFWIGVACAAVTMVPSLVRFHESPLLMFSAVFSLLAAFWSFKGRYLNVAGTVAYAALFFLLLWVIHPAALLGRP